LSSVLGIMALGSALALATGGGDTKNEVINIGEGTPIPTPTATPGNTAPTATATPVGGGNTRVVTITANSSAALQGFTIRVEYATTTGGFVGSADSVECTSAAPGFTPNDQDNGTMLLVAGSASALAFPIDFTCNFEELSGQTLSAGDINIVVQSVTEGGAAGDTADLVVSVGVV
jgi:hypothetical protein